MGNPSSRKLILKSCLLFLLLLLSSKPVLAYNLNWSVAIMLSGQQANQDYSVQGLSSYLGGNSSNQTYTVTAWTPETLPLQGTLTLQATPVSSALVRLNWSDLLTKEYYTLTRNTEIIASHIPKDTTSYDDTYLLKADTVYTYILTAYGTSNNIIASATCTLTTPKSGHKFIPYHNLFHPLKGEKVQIYYELDSSAKVLIKLYDLTGELVKELVSGDRQADKYWVEWDGKDKNGEECEAGVYIIQIQAGDFKDMRKIILVK
ncbi:MAG: FlgD immunoglobulin-like domain containing protein [Candidatus Desantisbacteria bacterium]